MSYCPNCAAEQTREDLVKNRCWNCDADFSPGSGWKPTAEPQLRFRAFPKQKALMPKTSEPSKTLSGILSVGFLWFGHFLLIGFPVLFFVYHLFFYTGGGTSGVPLAFSIIYAPISYLLSFVLHLISKTGRD